MVYNGGIVAPNKRLAARPAHPAAVMQRSIRLALLLFLLTGGNPVARAQSPSPADSLAAQTTIPQITKFESLSPIMNLARGTVRIVAIVSPSSPDAAAGLDVVASVLRDVPSKRLRAYVILSRAVADDTEMRALELVSRHRDRRIVYLWDPGALVAAAMAPVTGSAAPVHDAYFLYDTDATFTTAPATPVLWMCTGAHHEGPPLAAEPLRARAEELVRSVERKASAPPASAE